jgi:hypothetical protein
MQGPLIHGQMLRPVGNIQQQISMQPLQQQVMQQQQSMQQHAACSKGDI